MYASSFVMNDVLGGEFGAPGTSAAAIDRKALTDAFFSKLGQLRCKAFRLRSHIPHHRRWHARGESASTLLVNVARDLLQQYCRGSVVVDAPSFNAVAAHNPAAKAAVYIADVGNVGGYKQQQPSVIAEAGQMRGVLKGLCSAGVFDLTTLQAGQVRVLANTATYEAYVGAAALSALRLDETRIVADSL